MAEFKELAADPIVSVIITTYNRSAFIAKAIDSVLAQTFQDFELIIIDDGSTDNTDKVVAKFQDPRITYKWVENGERSRARNLGISMSRGQYIAFLDSDDWYLPNKLAVQVTTLQQEPQLGMALGGWLIVDESGRKIQEVYPWKWILGQPTIEQWLFSTTATPITLLVKKECLESVGGFDVELNIAEDVELWIRLALNGCQSTWTNETVAVVLVHGNNSLRNWSVLHDGLLKTLNKLFANPRFEEKLGLSHAEVFARFHLTLAWQAYETGAAKHGQEELQQAIMLYPALTEHNDQAIRKSIIDHSQYFLVAKPTRFVEQVLENLPPSLVALKKYRREVLGITWMSQAWRAHNDGDLKRVRESVFHAIWYRPSCLKDRGILSMLFESLLGHRLWQSTRPLVRSISR